MTRVTGELFCDPLAVAGWRHLPLLRQVEYTFPEVDWVLRPVVAHPTAPAGEAREELAERARRAGEASGLPVDAESLVGSFPASWPACEALAVAQSTAPGTAMAYLRQLRVETFAAGSPPADPSTLADVARRVPGLDPEEVADAVGNRRATAGLGRALERGRGLVAAIDAGALEVRGDPGRMPLSPRALDDGDETDQGDGPGDPDGDADGPGEPADDADCPDEPEEAPAPAVPAPPLARFDYGDRSVVVDPAAGFDEFADVLRGFDPDLGDLDWDAAIHGREAMQAYGVAKRTAENLSNERFPPKVRTVLERVDDAFVAEIAACADLDPDTTRVAVRELRADGVAERTPTGAWRLVPEEVD